MGNDTWEIIFYYALEQLRSAQIQKKDWSFGGGTVLMMKYNHRLSKDVDIFFREQQFLNYISPRINDALEDKIKQYDEHTNFTKIQLEEGEIDFIVSPQISNCNPSFIKVCNEYIYVEHPAEIILKKIFFRAENFKLRDIFDLATVIKHNKNQLFDNIYTVEDKLFILQKSISDLSISCKLEPGLNALNLTEYGMKAIRGKEQELCCNFIQEALKKIEYEKTHKISRNKGLEL
jgi:hypothetical protein